MTNEELAKELTIIMKKDLMEFIEEMIDQRCYLFVLEILKNAEKHIKGK